MVFENASYVRNKRQEIFLTFTKKEVIHYLRNLTKDYVQFFLNNDISNFNNTLKKIEDVVLFFDSKYPNIYYYFNYIFLLEIHERLNDLYSKNDVELTLFKPVLIDEIEGNKINCLTLEEMDSILSVTNEPDEETKEFLDKIGYEY